MILIVPELIVQPVIDTGVFQGNPTTGFSNPPFDTRFAETVPTHTRSNTRPVASVNILFMDSHQPEILLIDQK
jgi:hypothetical protein